MRLTGRAGSKVGTSDSAVACVSAVCHCIKDKKGIICCTFQIFNIEEIVCHIELV